MDTEVEKELSEQEQVLAGQKGASRDYGAFLQKQVDSLKTSNAINIDKS